MSLKYQIVLIIILGFFNEIDAQNIQGLWKEIYWSPMTSYYYFDTLNNSFKYYYHDDTHGSFGKGHFKVNRNKIIMDYDSIECDKPIIERLDNDLLNDSTKITFFHYWGFPKRIDFISNGEKFYSNWTASSDSIVEDYLIIQIPRKLDEIKIEIYDHVGLNLKMISSFTCRLYEKPFVNIYFYPCESWYDFKNPKQHEIKIKWIDNDQFDIKGKYKYKFKRIK